MKQFRKNIITKFRAEGEKWLNNLPNIIRELASLWQLTNIQEVPGLSWNYVATAYYHSKPVIIKVSCDKQLIDNEALCLQTWQGQGAIQLLAKNSYYKAILLEQAQPGYSLKNKQLPLENKIPLYTQVAKKLATNNNQLSSYFSHVESWFEAIYYIKDLRLTPLLSKAKSLKRRMLQSQPEIHLCHGDLHLDNILAHNNNWLAIDPKGVLAELAFDIAAFDLLPEEQIIPELIHARVNKLAYNSNIDKQRLINWIFLRAILSAQWYIEDGEDPNFVLDKAKYFANLVD